MGSETMRGEMMGDTVSVRAGWPAAPGRPPRVTAVLYLYLFLFIPLYNIALDAFVFARHGRVIPDAISVLKELAWLGVLAYYGYWLVTAKPAVRISRPAAGAAAIFFLWQIAEWFRALPHLGHLQAFLAVRNSLLYMPAMVIAAALAQEDDDWQKIADYLAVVLLLAGVYALLQLWGVLDTRWHFLAGDPDVNFVVPAFFSDYDVFAYFAAMAFMLVASTLGPGRLDWLRVAGAISGGVCVFVSESRGGLGAWLLGVGLIVLLGRRRRPLAAVLAAVVVIDALLFAITPALQASPRALFGIFYRRPVEATSAQPSPPPPSISPQPAPAPPSTSSQPPPPSVSPQPAPAPPPASSRPASPAPPTGLTGALPTAALNVVTKNLRDVRVTRDWPKLLHRLRQSPVIGYGLGVFGFAALSAAERRGPVADPLGVDNYYLTLGLNTGIIGLVLFLVLVYAVLRHGLRALSLGDGQGSRNVLVGLIAGLLVFLASGLFSNLIESFPISAFFWFIVGAISAWPAGSRPISRSTTSE